MNIKLKEYSSSLFENESECIHLSTDNTKLDILLGDTLYESLSGGEKKKVDLALVLAQRDIAKAISGFECNITVFDEILENLDATGIDSSLSLINDIATNLESIFLISHNEYTVLKADNIITVTKHPDRLSTISFA